MTASGCRASLGLDSRGRLPPQEEVLILHECPERFGDKRRPALPLHRRFLLLLSSCSSDWTRCQAIIPRARDEQKRLLLTSSFYRTSQITEPAKKASPKRADEHLNPAYCESMVHTCVPQPCQDVLLLCFSHRACCLRSSSPQLRRRRRRRLRPPRNNHQIRAASRAMNRCAQLRYSRLRDNRRQRVRAAIDPKN